MGKRSGVRREPLLATLIVAVACGWFGASLAHAQDPPAEKPVDYLKQIKPLLRERCYACHGGLKQQSGLRLDTVEAILRGGESGPAIVKSDASGSRLLERVSATDVAERMPPEHEGEPLSAEQISTLRAWIASGAVGPADEQPEGDPREHWAFRPVARPTPPASRADWSKNPIDQFIGAQHARFGLTPQPAAPRLTLLRRLSLDLVGVSPSPEEIAAFESDTSPDAYERAVDRLLADPRHGERWARHWMDIWRYSDWWGLGDQLRNSQKHVWHWRNWIVESLNADTPYDEMVRLMLAADELHPNDLNKLRASGYLARNYFLFNRNQWLDECVEHVSKGFLGLTFNCAKCHDHKYDPISQVDYYRMRAFFEPYHVRVDMAPGEVDLARDGIPRAFDGLLETPTYRFVRGQENQPDKSTPLTPGVPTVLQFKPLAVEPIQLPLEASQPERRPWVVEAYRAAARQKIAAAVVKVAVARDKLALAETKAALAKTSEPQTKTENPAAVAENSESTILEKFTTLDTSRWKLFGGDWSHEAGKLRQQRDGANRAALRLLARAPRDFDATLRLTIVGGSQWRSVCMAFDSTQADPTATSGPDDSEQIVYVSAFAGGPKVQAAWQRGGQWQYPTEGMVARPIELNREYTLRVQARDTLINASLDGEPAIAWRTPLARRDGSFLITTFDALAVLHEVSIAPLKSDVVLREPTTPSASPPPMNAQSAVADARLEMHVAELGLEQANAENQSVERRASAVAGDSASELAKAAARAEREASTALARVTLAEAELRLQRSTADKRDMVAKEVAAAREALDKAAKLIDEPSEQYTRLSGAQWTATRFFNSSADDPAVKFPATSSGRRRALADWITDRRNPLTARVAVNHLWSRHFGAPLAPNVFDFGRKGPQPANLELLDWLAAELVDSGWSMKRVHRLIVTSATYRLSSSTTGAEENLTRDRDNAYYWHHAPLRLESQAIRDSILSLWGVLDLKQGGPPVAPPQQTDSKRRSLYFFHSNNDRNLFLTAFDEALVKECYRRDQSIVPQQALALGNSQLVLDAARPIAERLIQRLAANGQSAGDDASFVRLAFAVLLGYEPTAAEIAASRESLDAWKKLPEAKNGEAADTFARANLIWVLLNHNDFVSVR